MNKRTAHVRRLQCVGARARGQASTRRCKEATHAQRCAYVPLPTDERACEATDISSIGHVCGDRRGGGRSWFFRAPSDAPATRVGDFSALRSPSATYCISISIFVCTSIYQFGARVAEAPGPAPALPARGCGATPGRGGSRAARPRGTGEPPGARPHPSGRRAGRHATVRLPVRRWGWCACGMRRKEAS